MQAREGEGMRRDESGECHHAERETGRVRRDASEEACPALNVAD